MSSLISIAALAIWMLAVAPSAVVQRSVQLGEHQEAPREQWQRVADIFRELAVVPGAHIADIGAGGGFFTSRLSKAVGATGRVYAVDVNPVSLRELKEVLGENAANVELVRGDEDNPHLPVGQLDAALVVNAYHEFAEHQAMLGHILAALQPGGRLVLVEPLPRAADTERRVQTRRHTIAMDLVIQDLTQAGFEIVSSDPAFVTRPEHVSAQAKAGGDIKPTDWLLVARRRAGSPLF